VLGPVISQKSRVNAFIRLVRLHWLAVLKHVLKIGLAQLVACTVTLMDKMSGLGKAVWAGLTCCWEACAADQASNGPWWSW